MASKKNKEWKLPLEEVTYQGSGSTSTHRRKLSRASRAVDDRSWRFKLIHLPTGIETEGEVPLGNYSKKQMQDAKDKLRKLLFLELEEKVAKDLRLSGW